MLLHLYVFYQNSRFYVNCYPVFYGDEVYKIKRVTCVANFISSGSKILDLVKRFRRRQYDLVIIERKIRHVLGPCTDLRNSFPEVLQSDKAMGTLWWVLFQLSQRRECLIVVPSDH